jgi:hypothetical protein
VGRGAVEFCADLIEGAVANNVTCTLSGSEAVITGLHNAAINVRVAARKAVLATAFLIMNDAKMMCPVLTGRLRASLSVNWTDSGMARGKTSGGLNYKAMGKTGNYPTEEDGVGGPEMEGYTSGFFAVVGTNVVYAESVENMATPYLTPAWMMHYGQLMKKIADLTGEAVAKGGSGASVFLSGNADIQAP